MICSRCRCNVNENARFCPNCGNSLQINNNSHTMNQNMNNSTNNNTQTNTNQNVTPNMQQNINQNMGKLLLKRDSKVFGCAIFYNVAINGQDAGVLGNGEQLQYNLPFGTYTVELRPITPPTTRQTITLTPQRPNVVLNITAGFAHVKIYNVQYF